MRILIVFGAMLAVGYTRPQYDALGSFNGISTPGQSGQRGGDKYLPPGTPAPEVIITKQFYLHSAPKDNSGGVKNKHFVIGRPQKNYRVVFIKAPAADVGNVHLSAEYAPQEEKTVIYVLSQKQSDLDLNDIATPAPTQPSKPEVFFIKYKTPEEAAAAQKEIQDGWQAFRASKRLQFWEYKKALVHVQTIYGIFPYFKISIENRFNKPYDYIITIEEGEIGLPDKYFYNIDNDNEIVIAYKMLLRDFAISMGIVTQEANLFADQIFHYEKRIVNHIAAVRTSNDRKVNEIVTLAEIKSIAPSLPIFESLQVIFPHMKISDETEILVRDIDVLREMSIIVSTSDKIPMNNFIIWSLARNLLPHLSKEYRSLIENFEHAVYGRTTTYPRWMVCTKIVRDWLPFAVDALQQNPDFLRISSSSFEYSRPRSKVFPNKTHGNDEFLRLMFHTLRNQVQNSVDEAQWIDRAMKIYINEKLTTMRLQIGIPEEVLNTKTYINEYYENLLLNNLFFVEHLESIWSFRKLRMEEKLKPLSIVDMIISEMYTTSETSTITYSTTLNMMVISKGIATTKYYDYRFPIPVNFARIGTDIVENLIATISIFVEQFKAEVHLTTNSSYYQNFNFVQIGENCLQYENKDHIEHDELHYLSETALKNFHSSLSAAKITAKALSTFIASIDNGYPIIGASIDPELTYEKLMLTNRLRIPGLRSFNENELFTLAYMQKHCSTSIADMDYARIKPHVEKKLAERHLFNASWNHVQFLARSSGCTVKDVQCPNIL